MAGLKDDGTPFLSGMDLIGAPVFTSDFVVSGTCTSNLHGMCESLYRPDMVSVPSRAECEQLNFITYSTCCFQNPDELFEVLSQSLLAAVDRDALSGWGAVVHIM